MSNKTTLTLIVILVLAIPGAYLGRQAWLRYEQKQFEQYLDSPTNNIVDVLVDIEPGWTMSNVSDSLRQSGVIGDARKFSNAAVRLGLDRKVKAGQYLLEPGLSLQALAEKLMEGDIVQERFLIVEGSTFASVISQLADSEHVDDTLTGLEEQQIWELIAPGSEHPPEGLLYPDTYLHGSGHPDIDLLKTANQKMVETLEELWPMRNPSLTLETPYEALILASIIEKETGLDGERGLVSSAFHNRLRIGMRLQSDPTVIYGLSDEFDGNLTRKHLETDTPYNTYTRPGLPPTPIAIPGKEAIMAALNPPKSEYLYFVADGSGGHHFSKTLREHINAVNRYQRNQ